MKKNLLAIALGAVTLSACTSVDTTQKQNSASAITSPLTSSQRWWLAFNDPLMDTFTDTLIAQNIDIKIAATRVTEARAIARQAHSRYFPELDLTGSSTRGNTQPGSTEPVTISRGGFDAAWEVDLFGGVRADNAAASARALAAGSDAQTVRNAVLADLLRAITEWRQATQTARATTALLMAQNEQINLFSIRAAAGLIDNTLVTRARAEREQTATQLPLATAAALTAQYQIERLLGKPGNSLASELNNAAQDSPVIPATSAILDTSITAVQRRPDIRAAEAELNAARADLASAKANLWPKLSLSGFFGVQEVSGQLLVADNPLWSAGAALSMPLLNFGKLHAAVDAADSRSLRAVAVYENTVLTALQETQTALADYLNGTNALALQASTLRYREDTVTLAEERFRSGLTDMIDLTTAQAELNRATILLIDRKAATAIAYIRLQKALATTVVNGDVLAKQ